MMLPTLADLEEKPEYSLLRDTPFASFCATGEQTLFAFPSLYEVV